MSATKHTKRGWRWIEIQCENCEVLANFDGNNVATARCELKKEGWSSKLADGKVLDFCPRCSQITQMYKRRKR